MPSELSGGMARRVALARAIALDPMLMMYDEPFAGLDPISLGVIGNLIRRLNDALGATSIVVTHDVQESLKIVDYVYFVSDGVIVAEGTADEMRASDKPFVHQFVHGEADGPVPFHYPARSLWRRSAIGRLQCLAKPVQGVRESAHRVVKACGALGMRAVSLLLTLLHSGTAFAGLRLTIREIYFTGVLSLIIILVSGLFVGMVLGLQGYETLQRYGSEEALGVLVALSLVRELGPVVAALLFASRAGSAITAEIGLMKATEQLVGDGNDGGQPDCPGGGAALLGRRDFHAAVGGHVFGHGRVWRLSGRRAS